jgi:hypothetical protein
MTDWNAPTELKSNTVGPWALTGNIRSIQPLKDGIAEKPLGAM